MAGKECVAIGSDLRFGVQLQVRLGACQAAQCASLASAELLGGCGLASGVVAAAAAAAVNEPGYWPGLSTHCCWAGGAGRAALCSTPPNHAHAAPARPPRLPQTLATDYKKIYKIHDQLFIGLAGLGTDAETL